MTMTGERHARNALHGAMVALAAAFALMVSLHGGPATAQDSRFDLETADVSVLTLGCATYDRGWSGWGRPRGVICWELRRRVWDDGGALSDATAVLQAFEKACDDEENQGCAGAKELYCALAQPNPRSGNACLELRRSVMQSGVSLENPMRFLRVFDRACDGGDMHGCIGAGELYGDWWGYAESLENQFRERRARLGDAIIRGTLLEVPRDPSRSEGLFRRACDSGYSDGCFRLARPDDEVARSRQACVAGNGAGCYSLGYMFETGDGAERNFGQAARMFARACELGSTGDACMTLGLLRGDYPGGSSQGSDGSREARAAVTDQQALAVYRQVCALGRDRRRNSTDVGSKDVHNACELAGLVGRRLS